MVDFVIKAGLFIVLAPVVLYVAVGVCGLVLLALFALFDAFLKDKEQKDLSTPAPVDVNGTVQETAPTARPLRDTAVLCLAGFLVYLLLMAVFILLSVL